jgi:chromosome partitioning protein
VTAKVLAIANQKGGVGKTTTALSLAGALCLKGKKVLVMDLDPHGCASVHMGYYPEEVAASAYDLFMAEEADRAVWEKVASPEHTAGFRLVPSHVRLSELDLELRSRPEKGLTLKKAISRIAGEYDYVIIDCPPHMGVLLVNALVASELLIIPIQTDFLALHGLRLIFDTVRMLNRVLPRPMAFKALATMYDKRAGACVRVLRLLRKKLGTRMFETVIGMDTKFREASADGKVIYQVAPDSRGAREYLMLAEEIVKL